MTAYNETAERRNNDLTEAQLVARIKAHIAKGDKAAEKSEQHYTAAGQYLSQLKEVSPDQTTFLALVKDKIGIGKSRTYELLQIAHGRKTVKEVRADTAERQEKHRLSVTNGQLKLPAKTQTPSNPPKRVAAITLRWKSPKMASPATTTKRSGAAT